MNWWTKFSSVFIRVHPWINFLVLLACGLCASLAAAQQQPINLAGTWRFAADLEDMHGAAGPEAIEFRDNIELPGQAAAQGFGEKPSFKTRWTGDGWRYPQLFTEWQADNNFKMPFFLEPPRHYVGPAWYQKDFTIPADWAGKHALLHLERVHWQSTVWVDGKKLGACNSLSTPHEFDLGELKPGKHKLTLRIDNRLLDVNVGPLSHSVTDHTQGNWNGAVGNIELRPAPALRIAEVRVDASLAKRSVKLTVLADGKGPGRVSAQIAFAALSAKAVLNPSAEGELRDGKAELTIPLKDEPRAWDEFAPHLYRAYVRLTGPTGQDTRVETFGFRDIGRKDGRLALNGTPIYLRGTLECCIFPLTGYPPTDAESWRRIIRVCKAHGLNHIRFHSWCPPEAAFAAADELGFYFQVECSSWANQGAEIGSGRPLDEWLEEESKRILAAYGNHPSFLLMAYGNEPAGKNHPQWLQQWVARRQKEDPRRFYTTGAGWPVVPGSDFHNSPAPRIQAWGAGLKSLINAEPPRTDFDWSSFLQKHSDAPVVSHEIGQWCVYPNFAEMAKYTGFFKPKNFEIFQETARRNGLLPQAKDFLLASGKLQTLCYKHDIEAALRTPGFGGFQLLDLHDFPGQGTALVGVVDAFWEGKGYVTPEEFAQFSGPIVPLAKLKKMIWTTDETLEAELLLSHFGPADLQGFVAEWTLTQGSDVVAFGKLSKRDLARGVLHKLGSIVAPLAKVKAPAQLKLTVSAGGQNISNSWDAFVYPATLAGPAPAADIVITKRPDEAFAALEAGKKVLLLAAGQVANDSQRPLAAGFSSIFWNTAWTKWQPPHTLGILCAPQHPALANFPTEYHSNWQWWEVQKDAQPFILTEHKNLRPIVQIIDDWFTNRKLGYVFEAQVGKGKLLACAVDIDTDLDARVVARQLRASLLSYMQTAAFAPKVTLTPEDVAKLFKDAK